MLTLLFAALGCSPEPATAGQNAVVPSHSTELLAEQDACVKEMDQYYESLGDGPAYPFVPCKGLTPQTINPWIYPYAGSAEPIGPSPMYPHRNSEK